MSDCDTYAKLCKFRKNRILLTVCKQSGAYGYNFTPYSATLHEGLIKFRPCSTFSIKSITRFGSMKITLESSMI